jgi:hypothetical protein
LGLELKRPWIWILICLNLGIVAVLVFVYPHLMVSPGPVVAGHAGIASDCFACHAPLRGASSARCVACHAVADIGLRTTKGQSLPPKATKVAFHQNLSEQNCMACHSDHASPKLTQGHRKAFSHAMLRTAVQDQCQSCHRSPADKLHRGVSGSCNQCHAQTAWKPAMFDHDKSFLLDADHKVQCSTCHTKNDYSTYSCYGCHEHTPDRIRAEHREEGIRDLDNCVRCHRSADGEGSESGEDD